MTTADAHAADLDAILARTRYLLIDFDGPICSIFAGLPAPQVADQLRKFFAGQPAPRRHPADRRPHRGIRLRGHRSAPASPPASKPR